MNPPIEENGQKKELESLKKQLNEIKCDMETARKKGYDLGPLYIAEVTIRREIDKLQQALDQSKPVVPKVLFDKQSLLSTSVIRRKDRSAHQSRVKIEDQTSQGKPRRQATSKSST